MINEKLIIYFFSNKLSTQMLSSLNSTAVNPAQHLMAQNYGTEDSAANNNSVKISPNAAALIQQMSASSSSQSSTSLPQTQPVVSQLNQQQLGALGHPLASNAQFNPMQGLQGKFF